MRRATNTPIKAYNIIKDFYPHSPCGERREPTAFRTPHHIFLSTLSLRRATAVTTVVVGPSSDFYPHSPCGERLAVSAALQLIPLISIHTLLAESDLPRAGIVGPVTIISIHTLLAESDTEAEDGYKDTVTISIHTLLAESDFCLLVY